MQDEQSSTNRLSDITLSKADERALAILRASGYELIGRKASASPTPSDLFLCRIRSGGDAAHALIVKLVEQGVISHAYHGFMNQADPQMRDENGRHIPDSYIFGIKRQDLEAIGVELPLPAKPKGKSKH